MTITMYDSITAANLPRDAKAVAGYVGGNWPTYPLLRALFPHAHILSVAVNASEDADCLDVENGDATNDDAPGWVMRQQQRGEPRPCVYTEGSNAQALIDTLRSHGIARSQFRLWSAHYSNRHICGPGACEYPKADGTQWGGGPTAPVDESLLNDDFFGGPPMSLTGPAHWDAKDWDALRVHDWSALSRALTGDVAGLSGTDAAKVTGVHDAFAALVPTAAEIAKAVVAALPPAEKGGITQAQVEAAVEAGLVAVLSKAVTGA